MYVSIDKDVLCQEDARTNWDQGDMKLEELELMVEEMRNTGIVWSGYLWGKSTRYS